MSETIYIKTHRIYNLTPKTVTIGIEVNRKITRVTLKITKHVYRRILQKMQKPAFSLNLPATFSVVCDTYGDGASFADGVAFTESKQETSKNDKDSPKRND